MVVDECISSRNQLEWLNWSISTNYHQFPLKSKMQFKWKIIISIPKSSKNCFHLKGNLSFYCIKKNYKDNKIVGKEKLNGNLSVESFYLRKCFSFSPWRFSLYDFEWMKLLQPASFPHSRLKGIDDWKNIFMKNKSSVR